MITPPNELPSSLRVRGEAQRGMFFEDIKEGDWFDSAEFVVDKESVVEFARTWDPQPFHIDEEAGRRSVFGCLTASGLQTILLSYRLYIDLGLFDGTALAGLGINNVLFKAPLRPGDRIRIRATIASARRSKKSERGVVKIAIRTFNQCHDEIASLELNMLLASGSTV